MTDAKSEILASIKNALLKSGTKTELPQISVGSPVIDNIVERFRMEWERNGGEIVGIVKKTDDADAIIYKFLTESFHSESVWISDETVCNGDWQNKFPNRIKAGNITAEQAAQCDTGISGCELILAETGTVAVASQLGRPRALTLLPPNVLFISLISQVVGNHEEALSKLAIQTPHGWVWISGPSRTADIEKVLVKGVHGPKRVAVLFIDDITKDNE